MLSKVPSLLLVPLFDFWQLKKNVSAAQGQNKVVQNLNMGHYLNTNVGYWT